MTAASAPLSMSQQVSALLFGSSQRELALFPAETGKQRLSLSYLDGGAGYSPDVLEGLKENGYFPEGEGDFGYYLIPLGESETASKDEDKTPDVGLMPARLVRLLDEEEIQLQNLRQGWLYVFVDGHLWREVKISDDAVFQDVNLAKYQGKNVRPSAGMGFDYDVLTLPYRLNGQSPTVQVAFSEIQWSWQYLCKMGGMSADDKRFLPDLAVHEPYRDIQGDEDFRESRFQTLDLSAYSDGWDIEKLKTHYLCPANAIEAHRSTEAGKELSSLSEEDITGRVAYLAVKDPLASARELADEYHGLIELEAALAEQADSSGEFPLAMLIKELVQEDEKLRHNQNLRQHVRMDKVENTIESWKALTKKLVSLRDQADTQLAGKLQQPQVRSALADYFQSGNDYCHAMGVIHWTILTGECLTTEMASYQQRTLRGEEEWLESMQRLPFPVVEQMRRIAAMNEPEFSAAKYNLTNTLGPEASIPITTAVTGAIGQLIDGFTRLHTDKLVNLAAETLNKVADDILHLTGVAMQALQVPLGKAVPLGQNAPLKPGEYRFQPKSFSRSMKAIGESRIFQLMPEGKSVSGYLESLSNSSEFQRYAARVLAPLHIVNAALAVSNLTKKQKVDELLPAYSSIMSALSFFGGQAEAWAKNNLEEVRVKHAEADRLVRKSEKILKKPNRHSKRSLERAFRRKKTNLFIRESYKQKGEVLKYPKIMGFLVKKVFGTGAGLTEVVFGSWNVTKGVATGNAQVAAGGGLGVVGGALITWGVLSTSSVVAAPLGVVLALAGGVAVLLGERSKLEDALRLGYFGQDAYPVIGGPFDEPEDPVRLEPESGLIEQPRHFPDLGGEINYFRRLFCQVSAHVGIHRESKPSMLPMGNSPAPTSNHMIVKARVDMSGYQVGQSKLNLAVSVFHEPGWFSGKSGLRYVHQALYTKEVMDGEDLVAVEAYVRLPRRAVIAGAEIEASLDLLGDGSLIAPTDGPVILSSWVEENTGIADHAWQHIENTANRPEMQPEEIN